MTWANQPAVGALNYADTPTAKGYNSTCAAGDVTWNVTDMVQGWHDGFPNRGLRLAAADETSNYTWRRYRSANYSTASYRPRLTVTYNSYPDTPQGLTVSPGNSGYSTSTTPTFKATVTDPDKSKVSGVFEVYQGTVQKWTGTAQVNSGSVASVTVPAGKLVNGTTYTVKVKGNDGVDDSKAYTSPVTFTVDTTKPDLAKGSVTATSFSDGQWRSDIPQANTFTFTGPADTKSFSYSEDGGTAQPKTADASGKATVSWLPKTGSHTMSVTATDKAGNVGAPVLFTFGVGPASFVAPSADMRSTAVFPVQASGKPNATSATLSWRYAGKGDWNPVMGAMKNGAAWNGDVANSADGAASVTGALTWDATKEVDVTSPASTKPNLQAPALIELQACFAYTTGGSQCSSARPVQLVPSAFGGNFPTANLGPASVALFTGEMTFSEPDAVDTTAGVGRTFSSFDGATTTSGPFGPGWSTSLLAPGDTSADLIDHRVQDGTFVLVTAGNASQTFAFEPTLENANQGPTGNIAEFAPAGIDDGSRLVVKDGTATLTRPQSATTSWTGSGDVWTLDEATTDTGTQGPTASFDSSKPGYPTWIAQTEPGASTTCTAADQSAGCRGLKITYDGADSLQRVTQIDLLLHGAAPVTIAKYTYSSNESGRTLTTACGRDPDDDGPLVRLCTAYGYTTVSDRTVIKSASPAGQKAWNFAYDGTGRLTTVTRDLDPNSNVGTGPATWAVRYDLSPAAAGLGDLSSGAAAAWGQSTVPTKAFAVFDPSDIGTNDLTQADVYYTDDYGTTTNTATHGNVNGTSQWLVDTTWHDANGNITQTLDGAGRARALQQSSLPDEQAAARDASAFTVFNKVSADDPNPVDGNRVEDEYGPVHQATLKDGTSGSYRSHTAYVYDDEDTSLGGGHKPSLDEGQTSFNLVVQETHSAADPDMTGSHDPTVVRYDYNPIVTDDGNGWSLGTPTQTKTLLEDGSWSTKITRYDTQGREIETRQPGGAANADGSGADAHATTMTYYGPAAAGDCNTSDKDHPGRATWIGQLCTSGPAAQPAGTAMPITYYAAYNDDLQPTTVQDLPPANPDGTPGKALRTTTTSYDLLGRPLTTTIATDDDTRTSTRSYDADSGLPTKQSNADGAVQTEYDGWGRPWKYTDATGMVSTTYYTTDGQVATRNDGVGTYTYGYDVNPGEHRRLPNTVSVGLAAGTPDTFTLGYNANGAQTSVAYPNGVTAAYGYNETGTPTKLTYADSSGATLLAFANTVDVDGRVLEAGSDASDQNYGYDALGRLTSVQDVRDGQCTTRTYGFSAASERTSFSSYSADVDGNCQTATSQVSKTNTYDSANRITNAGYTYDNLGRTLATPKADTAPGATGDMNLTYDANDMVKSMQQPVDDGNGGNVVKKADYGLDATGRIDTISNSTAVSETNRLRYRFSDESDSPSSIQTSTDAGATWTVTRYVNVPGLGMVGAIGGTPTWQLANLHGDIVATSGAASGTVDSYTESDEYGNAIDTPTAPQRYGWLGTHQRASDTVGDMVLMGARIYNPQSGLFTSADPVLGGGSNRYGYPVDPINQMDLTGEMWGWVFNIGMGALETAVDAGCGLLGETVVLSVICGALTGAALGAIEYVGHHDYVTHTRWSYSGRRAAAITGFWKGLGGGFLGGLSKEFTKRAVARISGVIFGALNRVLGRLGWKRMLAILASVQLMVDYVVSDRVRR